MKFKNLQQLGQVTGLREAVLKSLSDHAGLYMPVDIPLLPTDFFNHLHDKSLPEIGFEVAQAMLGDDIPAEVLQRITKAVLNFPVPLRSLNEQIHVLELFHGPTLAFKDVGARFMAALFEYLIGSETKEVTILVATSGDTGSAVADAFYQREGIQVCILYPSGKVSALQEKQLTTMGGNIQAIEVAGSFDDCQRMVKQAFADKELNKALQLTSANSINFTRLFPQSFYYFHAVAQLGKQHPPVYMSVPSGNFGNLSAGLMAWKMGLPVARFIAATNSNHIIPDYLASGLLQTRPVCYTISNAMDVAVPSNLPRMQAIFDQDLQAMRQQIAAYWCTDETTRTAIRELWDRFHYMSDPHGAIGYYGLTHHLPVGAAGIFLETAHPAKFPDVVSEVIGQEVAVPDSLQALLQQKKQAISMSADFVQLKEFLLS